MKGKIMAEIWQTISSIDFWTLQIDRFAAFGPLVPVFLAFLESFIPPLPMVGIVAVTIAAHGPVIGTIYCWIGTCLGCTCTFLIFRTLFLRVFAKKFRDREIYRKADSWVREVSAPALFLIVMMPFTPSAFVNFAFGISDFPVKKYLLTLYAAKTLMIGSLAFLGQSALEAINNPKFIVVVVILFLALYYASLKVRKRHHLDS